MVEVPTMEQFNALKDEVEALKTDGGTTNKPPSTEPPVITPPEPPIVEPEEPPEPIPPIEVPETGFHVTRPPDGPNPMEWRKYRVVFKDKKGSRLTGTPEFIVADSRWPGNPRADLGDNWRYVVDGNPSGKHILIDKLSDGPHVIGVQLLEDEEDIKPFSQVFIVSKSGEPQTTLHQPLSGDYQNQGLSHIWVDIRPPTAAPLKLFPMRTPETDEERLKLSTEARWTSESMGANAPRSYARMTPYLVKNEHGDYFVRSRAPQLGGDSATILDRVAREPAYDGERGIAATNPYETMTHGHVRQKSGHMGMLTIDVNCRICDVDITGERTTIFGPRSVAGVVPTDPDIPLTLDDLIKRGEKEWVGEDTYRPQDTRSIYMDPDDHDLHYIASFGSDSIDVFSRSEQRIIRRFPANKPTWVWTCHHMRERGVRYCYTNKEGLWMAFVQDGKPDSLDPIPGAMWLGGKEFSDDRGKDRTWVITDTFGIYECDPNTGKVSMVVRPSIKARKFIFGDIDVNGNIGPKNRIYFGHYNGGSGNTAIFCVDPGEWKIKFVDLLPQAQLSHSDDFLAKYPWGFAIHHHLPMFFAIGGAQTDWIMHRAYLDGDPDIPGLQPIHRHVNDFWYPAKEVWEKGSSGLPALAHVFGHDGNGEIGYSTALTSYRTVEDARAVLEPFGLPPDKLDAASRYLWFLSDKDHTTA